MIQIILMVSISGEPFRCSSMFFSRKTNLGLCYTTNFNGTVPKGDTTFVTASGD